MCSSRDIMLSCTHILARGSQILSNSPSMRVTDTLKPPCLYTWMTDLMVAARLSVLVEWMPSAVPSLTLQLTVTSMAVPLMCITSAHMVTWQYLSFTARAMGFVYGCPPPPPPPPVGTSTGGLPFEGTNVRSKDVLSSVDVLSGHRTIGQKICSNDVLEILGTWHTLKHNYSLHWCNLI